MHSTLLGSAFLAATLPVAAAAQIPGRFEGRLVHEGTGTPVAGASVSVVGLSGSARTDADGRFTWAPAPSVPFQIIVVLSGGQVARPIVVHALQDGSTAIEVAGMTDEAITVLGAAPSINAPPGSAATILSGTQLSSRSPENLLQALETVPGISTVSEGHVAVPAVRGLARGRTLFLVDGGRITSERRVGPSGSFLDPSVIEGIDVARGPGSVAYGSDALGGVVSVRTRRAEPGSPLRVRVTGGIGVGVPEARGSFEVSKGLEHGGVLVQTHVRNAEDYDSPGGEVFNSGWEDRGILVNFNHAVAQGSFSASWQSDFGRDFERPRRNSRTVRFYYPFENSHRLTLGYELADLAGFRRIAVNGFLGHYEQRTDQDQFATPAAGRRIERADVAANDFHVKGSAERLAGGTRIELGIDVNGRDNLEALDVTQGFDAADRLATESISVSIDAARRIDTGLYFQAESALTGAARISGGIRADRVTTTNTGGFFGDRSTSNTAASGFGAVTVGPFDGFSVTAQISRGFRDPVLSDRYFRGPSGRGFITGNPDLEPETSLQFDVAARYTLGDTQFAVYWYEYRIGDLIERFEDGPDLFFFRNRGRARLRGVEAEVRSRFRRGYSIEIAAQLARGRALDDGAGLDDISPATVSIVGRKEFGARQYSQVRLAWYGDDRRPGPTEVATPGATVLDVGAGWQLSPRFELRGLARNVLDDSHYASPDPQWVLAPGRSLNVTAVARF